MASDRTHSREFALNEREFELLLRGARELKEPFDFEARLVIHLAAKLGLRAGEIAHLRTDWINFYERVIEIPQFDECDFGSDGGVCGYCRGRARDRIETINLSLEEAKEEIRDEHGADVVDDLDEATLEKMAKKKQEETNITMEEALEERWNPKTSAGSRAVPFDFDVRTQMCIEEFADQYDRFPKSRATVNRRINQAAEEAGLEERVFPHALRATSASLLVLHGVSAHSLMAILGWEDISTARVYISSNEQSAANEVRSKHR
ncbi:site-specific integrase [Natrinema sp. DC36]|uniref:site-specific integrase n=1 Tax=Natrinema sp. DC36 TaxID=2878680 RepID=UPI001CF03A6A|nr:site-specific integrase [Natrinema sp. DC36]